MPLKSLLKKKDKSNKDETSATPDAAMTAPTEHMNVPDITFVRTTTPTQEVIQPPSYPGDDQSAGPSSRKHGKSFSSHFRKASNTSVKSLTASVGEKGDVDRTKTPPGTPPKSSVKGERRLSERFKLGLRSRSASATSVHVPEDLPEIGGAAVGSVEKEVEWEKRATLLAEGGSAEKTGLEHGVADLRIHHADKGGAVTGTKGGGVEGDDVSSLDVKVDKRNMCDKVLMFSCMNRGVCKRLSGCMKQAVSVTLVRNDNFQMGETAKVNLANQSKDEHLLISAPLPPSIELERSTAMFGKLADPKGANNALSQVLYGLALRHGWGIAPSPAHSLHYLRLAARSAAITESAVLSSGGSTSGGPAKGELVLAIFELANSFRHGWGVEKDPVAAYRYYETAANLGDVDGMEWAAWCLLEGFGVPKDKYKAAQYLRLAESKGHKVVGNSWIWKEKYNPKT